MIQSTANTKVHLQAGCRHLCLQVVNTCGAASGRPGLSESKNDLPCSWCRSEPVLGFGRHADTGGGTVKRAENCHADCLTFLRFVGSIKLIIEPRVTRDLGHHCSSHSAEFLSQCGKSCLLRYRERERVLHVTVCELSGRLQPSCAHSTSVICRKGQEGTGRGLPYNPNNRAFDYWERCCWGLLESGHSRSAEDGVICRSSIQ